MQNLDLLKATAANIHLCSTGIDTFATYKGELYRGRTMSLDWFVSCELIRVFESEVAQELSIQDKDGKLVNNITFATDLLEISPSFFNQGYSLFAGKIKVFDLTTELWKRLRVVRPEVLH